MLVTGAGDWIHVTKRFDYRHRLPRLGYRIAVAVKDMGIALSMQIDKTVGKFEIVAIDGDVAKGRLAGVTGDRRKVMPVNGQEPSDPGRRKFKTPRRF